MVPEPGFAEYIDSVPARSTLNGVRIEPYINELRPLPSPGAALTNGLIRRVQGVMHALKGFSHFSRFGPTLHRGRDDPFDKPGR
jgi:hypothetical protein